MKVVRKLERWIGKRLAALLPEPASKAFVVALGARDPEALIGGVARYIKAQATDLDRMPFDLSVDGELRFEHLAGLFASTTLDEAVISMSIRQTAYLFGLVRSMKPQKVIEIGRYKGGSTLVIAAAMRGQGRFWSIDLADLEPRLRPRNLARPVPAQIAGACERFGLRVELIAGDSRTVEVDTGEVDLVFVDGDHSYEGARSDFERFGRRVRAGGALLFDDAFEDGVLMTPHSEPVGRLVREIEAEGEFRLVRAVNKLAHLERLR